MNLGVREHETYTHGMSSKGPWVLSSSQAVHQALPVALLEERGLPILLRIWKTLTAKSRTAWCGPACQVAWKGLRGNPDPYPDRWFGHSVGQRPTSVLDHRMETRFTRNSALFTHA
jgi:hypothetical protein